MADRFVEDLANRIHTDKSMPDWDEQYIEDLAETEFEVIVE